MRTQDRELIIDSFAGGGGASLGIKLATGRCPDVAINHDAAAIAMHAANHPETRHFTEDVWKVSPRSVTRGRPVGLLWASPDCKHFSRAKGSKPVEKSIRSLAWIVVRWASECKPRIIVLENVREFEGWGPLVPQYRCQGCEWRGTEGQATLGRRGTHRCPRCESRSLRVTEDMVPDPKRIGLTFRRFVGRLKGLGYVVQWKTLDAADYGAPTHRRRLFLIARNDGEQIVWPQPTHGDPKTIGKGLFDRELKPWRTAAECIDWSLPCPSIFERKRPLAEKTLRRIALGIKRYVLDNPSPFIVPLTHHGERRVNPLNEPIPTVTGANRGELAMVSPYIARLGQTNGNGDYTCSVEKPLTTVTSKAEHLLVSPTLINVAYGSNGRWGDGTADLQKPLGTIHSGGNNFAACVAFLAKHYGGVVGVPVDTPLPTTTMRGTQNQIVAANLIHLNHGEKQWSSVDDPMRTNTTGKHAALVYSFLTKYFGTAIGQDLGEPLHTVTGKDRFGLVTVLVNGEPHVIVDIGMRMLTPRELARGQGFPDTYELTGTKTSQTARIGNSVCPQVAQAIVEANYSQVPAMV